MTLDYPTFISLNNLEGIERYLEYFSYLKLENIFYSFFDNKLINEMLLNYYCGNSELIFNISYLLIKQIILKQIINEPITSLVINKNELLNIYTCFNSNDIRILLNDAFETVMMELQVNNEIIDYYRKRLDNIMF